MSDQGQESEKPDTPGKREVMPRGQRLPNASMAEVRDLVVALHELNGPASRNLVFGQVGKAATGGVADTRWASMGYYGFRTGLVDGKCELTNRGAAFVSGDATAELEAKQHAVMSTGFRGVINRFSTRAVNEGAIAGVLRDDLGVKDTKSEALAALVVAVATDAGFISDGKFQAAPIEAAMEAVPAGANDARPATRSKTAPAKSPSPPASARPLQSTPGAATPASHSAQLLATEGGDGQSVPFGVSLEITIEAQHHTPEQIGEIVRQVREALTED